MENNAKLQEKLLEIERGLKYIKADKKGASNQTFASRNAVIGAFKPLAIKNGVKMSVEVLSSEWTQVDGGYKQANFIESKTSTSTEDKKGEGGGEKKSFDFAKNTVDVIERNPVIDQKIIYNITASLKFSFTDTITGFEKSHNWVGMWSERTNIGFGMGALITYAKRQFLIEFFNIETDDMEPEDYEIKHSLDKKESERKKVLGLYDMIKNASSKAEMDFAMEVLTDSDKSFENEDWKNLTLGLYNRAKSGEKKESIKKYFNIPEHLCVQSKN